MSRVRADKFVDRAATGAPTLTYGAEVPVGYGITGAGGINVSGMITATAGFGGNATGLFTDPIFHRVSEISADGSTLTLVECPDVAGVCYFERSIQGGC